VGAATAAVLALTLLPLAQSPGPAPTAVAAPRPADAPSTAGPAGASADPAWTERTAAATGIPARALRAYAAAALTVAAEQPACGLSWNTLAGIGAIETRHGSHGGAVLRDDGYPDPAIRGIPLDGTRSAVIRDTDGGRWDGDTVWDRAVGPMQFIPDTWERWGADGNGDGRADPNQIDDAALAAGRYLCADGEMTSVEGWRSAILSYNRLEEYVDDVAGMADGYAARAAG
jgi:membrane-bound lytic murein transglycosylase B